MSDSTSYLGTLIQYQQEPPPASYGDAQKCDPAKLRHWVDSGIMYAHPYRIRQHSTWRKADLYDQAIQWLIKSYQDDPTKTPHWAQLEFREDDPEAIPTPVFNEFSGPMENETARLGRPEYKGYVRPEGEDPDVKTKAGAKLAEHVLAQSLDDMRWPEQEELGLLHMPLYGGWWLISYWDQSWEKTTRIPVLGAVSCPTCGLKLASPTIPVEHGGDLHDQRPDAISRLDGVGPDGAATVSFKAQRCFMCPPGGPPMLPVSEEQGEMPDVDDGSGPGTALAQPGAGGAGLDTDAGMGPALEEAPPLGSAPSGSVDGSPQPWTPPTAEPTPGLGGFPYDPKKDHVDDSGPSGTPDAGPSSGPHEPSFAPNETADLGKFVAIGPELGQSDFFGRPLGQDVPIGEWVCRTASPYDVFAANLGIDVQPSTLKEFTWIHVEDLDWIRNRFDNGAEVRPENPEALMQFHPVAGERALYYGSGASAVGLFRHHSRVKERHKKPWRQKQPDGTLKMNKGRSVVMSGGVVLFDGDYLLESKNNPGTYIPRIKLDYAPWKIRSGGRELSGISLSEQLFDAQDAANEAISQIQDARQREGSPKWRVTRGMDLDYETAGEAGAHWVWDPDPMYPDREPVEVGGRGVNSQVFQELESIVNFISRCSNLNEVESGNVPSGVTAALALQILAEQSGERRRPRIRRIREMLERVWTHGLQLQHELCREPRQYWVKEDGRNDWRQRTWQGLDLCGQTQVRIDAEPDHDTAVVEQQKIKDAVQMQPSLIQDPTTARQIAQKMGVPADLFEVQNQQDEWSAREFSDFKDKGEEPLVDQDLDDHAAHCQRHGIDMHSEWWRDLERDANWHPILEALWDWETAVTQPGPPQIDPTTGQPQMQPVIDPQTGQPQADQTGQMAMEPVPGPSIDQQIPPELALELRVFQSWQMLLQRRGFQPEPGTEQSVMMMLRWRAHYSAHKFLGEQQAGAAAGGTPQMAAPESTQQTGAGTVAAPA